MEIYTKNVFHMDIENSKTAVSITMVFLGALLTGLDIYPKIAKYAGAGTIVPITGFAKFQQLHRLWSLNEKVLLQVCQPRCLL